MASVRGWIRAWIPTAFWVAALAQTLFIVALIASDGYDVARTGEALRVALTYTTLLALFGLVHLLVPSPRWNLRVNAFVFALFVAVNFARYETAGSFDYGFAHANVRELFTPLGRHIVLANVRAWEVAVLFVFPLLFGAAIARWPSRPWPGSPSSRRVAVVACVMVLFGVPAARITTHESLTGFAVSALRFHAETRAAAASVGGAPYPFVHESVPSERARTIAGSDAPRPHVILLFLESWSGRYSSHLRPDGRPFTPVFDEQRQVGLSYDHFYGNSVQSSRGHFATLCSLMPMVRAKEFVDIPETQLHCLPRVLKEAGYRTSFHSATDEPEFDMAESWLTSAGFDSVHFVADRNVAPEPDLWGVGLQDDVFYTRFFAALDEQVAREPGVPQLAVLANASNHYPFDKNPKHLPDPAYPTKYGRNYVASLGAADAFLASFFRELDRRPAFRDAIVVLVGDHSFPADEHGIHFNGLGSFDEAFHTGFAMRWRGHLPPQLVTDRAASQIDIAPTIVDLLQLRARTHFTGASLVAGETKPPVVPLVQPYDGVQLAAVRWPFKLVRQESSQQEHLYDLSQDPEEEHDRIRDSALAGEATELRETFARIHTSESILRANRVWPARP